MNGTSEFVYGFISGTSRRQAATRISNRATPLEDSEMERTPLKGSCKTDQRPAPGRMRWRYWRRGRGGGAFLGPVGGLWVVSCGQFGFPEEAVPLPRNAVDPSKKRAVASRRYPVQHCSYRPPDDRQPYSNGPVSQVAQWSHAISWQLHVKGKERSGGERNGVQTAREAEAASGFARCI
jgi:hypothetical protein